MRAMRRPNIQDHGQPDGIEPLAIGGPYCVRILNAGGAQSGENARRMNRSGNAYNLVSVREGTLTIKTRHISIELGPGDGAFLAPSDGADWRATMRSLYFSVAFVVTPVPLTGPLGDRRIGAGAPRQPAPRDVWGVTPSPVLSATLARRCHQTIDLVRGEYWQDDGRYLHACARLALLLSEIVFEATQPPDTTSVTSVPGLATAVQQRVREIGHPVPRIRALARHLGVSREYLSRAFKQETGRTLASFLNDARWAHAVELLSRENCTMTAVASGCGFHSTATLNAAFHRRFGCSPSGWRKRHRES